jgi:hypothetical protein
VPVAWSYAFVRWFHAPSSAVLVVAPSIRAELTARGFKNLAPWSRGVDIAAVPSAPRTQTGDGPADLALCRAAGHREEHQGLPRPRPAGHQVGGGRRTAAPGAQRRYKDARFFGSVDTDELSMRYAEADCFVFPSRTDTFGLVMVEALASGVPVAGYPVPGPLDVVTDPRVGALDEDLRTGLSRRRRPRHGPTAGAMPRPSPGNAAPPSSWRHAAPDPAQHSGSR